MKTRQAGEVADVSPHDGSCTLRWPNGSLWVPVLAGTGLFGRITRADRADYVANMESQLRGLERAVNHHREELGKKPWPPHTC